MASFQWRRGRFFDIDKEELNLFEDGEFGEDNFITSSSSGAGNIVLGDCRVRWGFCKTNLLTLIFQGYLWRLSSPSSQKVTSFRGWENKVEELFQSKQVPYLLGLGMDGYVKNLKIWNLDKHDKSGNPVLLRTARLAKQNSQPDVEPVSLAASDDLQLLAVAFSDGGIVLHRGEITRDARYKKTIREKGHPVSAMSFVTGVSGSYLYVATSEDVLMFNVSVKDKEERSKILDTKGCIKGLAVSSGSFLGNETHFMTGQHDAVYCYNPDGRGQCYPPIDVHKKLLYAFGGYIAVVTEEKKEDGIEGKEKITILDVQNRFIAGEFPIKPIIAILSEWGATFLVSKDGKLKKIKEKDTQTKLQNLINRNFFLDAIKIARSSGCEAEILIDIHRQFGDNLYEKGDLQGAIDQYSSTIGFLEPSYVIQRFLEASKIHNLTDYLQELHRVGRASKDHTTLLLNCYTKLKHKDKLDEFIMNKEGKVFDFDVEHAINVCRQAGYVDHAMQLAEKHGKHDDFLKILIDNASSEEDYLKALKYIEGLPPVDADTQLRAHGSVLIVKASKEYTRILNELIGRWDGPIKPEKGLKQMKNLGFVGGGGRGILGDNERMLGSSVKEDLDNSEFDIGSKDQFNADKYIHLFVNDPKAMVEFLENLLSYGKPVSKSVVDTLLEYQLYIYKETEDEQVKKALESKILDGLSKKDYSVDQALVLCQLNDFQPGLLFLHQNSEMYDQILKHYFSSGQIEEGIDACKKFGHQDHQLWVTALESIAGADNTEIPGHLFKEVLDNIERYRLLSPLQVVSTLSSCPNATLGVVRDYLLKIFVAEQKAMEKDRETIEEYKKKGDEARDRLEKLSKAYEIRNTKCSGSNRPLELPAVHFLCGCSFNEDTYQGMTEDPDQDFCPRCARENNKIRNIIKNMEDKRNKHDQFHDLLGKADDGFR